MTDLHYAVESQAENAALFVDCLWKGIEEAEAQDLQVPSAKLVNQILEKHRVPLRIDPPNLLQVEDAVIVDASAENIDHEDGGALPTLVLGDQIGAGGYGTVYRATRSTIIADFVYAVKILDPSPFVENYEKALARFQKEIKALQSLQHRAIVTCIEAGLTADKKPYIVMPFIEGVNVREAASNTDFRGTLGLFIEILTALDYAHSQNVLHRDLKPSNILVRSSDQQPIIVDFGAAYILDEMDRKSLTSQPVGTIGYIPTEVLINPKKRSPLHDVYSCGMILYEPFAGHLPDPNDYQPLSDIDENYAALDEVIKSAIAGEKYRIASAGDFAKELNQL